MKKSTRCAGCKYLRRRCPPDCVLKPYFPSTNPQRFSFAHKVYGASNITRILTRLQEHLRAKAADSMCYEANIRVKDPVYGCVGEINRLQQQIIQGQNEIKRIKDEMAVQNALRQQQLQLQYQQQMVHANDKDDAFSYASSIEQKPNLSISQQPFDASTFAWFP
ncbi:LOB domain-containing protein 24-like [Gastrolobium bilobum]|uniref:LOB domain-containing protein 24-like n=1 Tax=Gastrolobium bilobum TaxID=150636 RepID=UPI002AB1B417|nr:LOB domain-containing protein 24-like [Gastrolobium bilobum]